MPKALTLLIFISVAVFGCAANTKNSQSALESLVKEKLGAAYTTTSNETKEFVLCQQTASTDHPNRKFKFIVVSVADNTIVHQGVFQNGYVKWIAVTAIEVSSAQLNEIVQKNVIQIKARKS